MYKKNVKKKSKFIKCTKCGTETTLFICTCGNQIYKHSKKKATSEDTDTPYDEAVRKARERSKQRRLKRQNAKEEN